MIFDYFHIIYESSKQIGGFMRKFLRLAALVAIAGLTGFSFNAQAAVTGKNLFQTNCAACHGTKATGVVGPNIVGKSAGDITKALKTVAMMASLRSVITKGDVKAISEYLNSSSITGK